MGFPNEFCKEDVSLCQGQQGLTAVERTFEGMEHSALEVRAESVKESMEALIVFLPQIADDGVAHLETHKRLEVFAPPHFDGHTLRTPCYGR